MRAGGPEWISERPAAGKAKNDRIEEASDGQTAGGPKGEPPECRNCGQGGGILMTISRRTMMVFAQRLFASGGGELFAHQGEDIVEAVDTANDVLGKLVADDGLDGCDHVNRVERVDSDFAERARKVNLGGGNLDGFREPFKNFAASCFVSIHLTPPLLRRTFPCRFRKRLPAPLDRTPLTSLPGVDN